MLVSELSLKYERSSYKGVQIKSSKDIVSFLRDIWPDDLNMRERFYVITLDRANKITGFNLVSLGGVGGTVVDAKLVFPVALLALSSCIILAHNHPSGNLRPSQADITLTRKLVDGGKLLDISVLDHIILTEEHYYSMLDQGDM